MKLTSIICPTCRGSIDINLAGDKNSMICPYCDQRVYIDNETKAAFKHTTDTHIFNEDKREKSVNESVSSESNDSQIIICPNCMTLLDNTISRGRETFFCPGCGQKVHTTKPKEPEPVEKKEEDFATKIKKQASDFEEKLKNAFSPAQSSKSQATSGTNKKSPISDLFIGFGCLLGSLILLSLLLVFLGNSSSDSSKNNSSTKIIYEYVPYSSEECVGKDKDSILSTFKGYGFTNVQTNALGDLEAGETEKLNLIDSITINGDDDFEKNDKYKQNATIVINYHSLQKTTVPISSEKAKELTPDEIKTLFQNAGFINVAVSEADDLDPDTTDAESMLTITVDGVDRFDESAVFPLDAQINIVTHNRYEKYNLTIVIDFTENLMFSTYDVNMTLGEQTEELSHGKDAEFEYRLKQGEYTLNFVNVEDDSVGGSTTINLTGDTKAKYKISCYYDEVEVEKIYLENYSAVGENEAMIPKSSSDCEGEDFNDITDSFKEAGFTNISYEILYDIYWGITEEGEIEEVSIDGDTSFTRGDIYSKDAEIIITYHMNEEDAPDEDEEDEEDEPESYYEPEVSVPDEPESLFYSTNDYETAKKGNSGVFSYRERGGSYDIYWIIDFDEGYVYYFTDGNGESFCDRLKIESGTLNDKIIITYHDGGDVWSYSLHFKYVNHPETLIMVDQNGFDWEYTTTDLDDALEKRATKTIKDY